MSFLRTLVTGAAIVATGSVPGKSVHDASQADFSITSCNGNSVEIHGSEADTLKTGDILTLVGNDGSVCEDCVPLFRKIVSRNEDTFETTFATFGEVFPKETYDATLANVEIESMLGCSHSGYDHRLLQGNATWIVEQCGNDVLTSAMIMLLSVVMALSLILLPCALIGWMISWLYCPPLWKSSVLGAGSILIPNLNPSRRSLEEYHEIDFSLGSFQMQFPSAQKDWTAKDSDGNCLYVDCHVGFHESPAACFDSQNFCANVCETSSNLLGFSVESNQDIDFAESCCIHDYCYASKFDKVTCDNQFHKSMVASCPTLDSAVVATNFPLDISTLSNNCNMLSFLFFLGVRVFGNNAYEASQVQQNAYNEAVCARSDALQI